MDLKNALFLEKKNESVTHNPCSNAQREMIFNLKNSFHDVSIKYSQKQKKRAIIYQNCSINKEMAGTYIISRIWLQKKIAEKLV